LLFFFLQSVQIFANSTPKHPDVAVEFLNQRGDTSSVPLVLFHLKDFPTKEEITFSVFRPLFGEIQDIVSFTVDEQENIHFPDKTQKGFIQLSGIGFLQGERAFFSFRTKQRELIELSLIPHQIAVENADGIALGAELLVLKPAIYNLLINGLKEGEKYIFQSESEDELIRHKRAFSSNHFFTVSPDVLEKAGGVGKVSIQVGNQTLSLDLPWGEAMDDYANGAKIKAPSKKEGISL
jgi:hypothetical protein